MTRTCRTGVHDDHDVYSEMCPCRTLLDLLANKWSAPGDRPARRGARALQPCGGPGCPVSARRC